MKKMFPASRHFACTLRNLLPGMALIAAGLSAPAAAQQPAQAEVQADASAYTHQITVMAGACANCHGTDGAYAGAIPAIAGRPAGVLESQLLTFKTSEPGPNNTVMGRIVKGFSDAELRQLAQFYANVDKR